MSVLEKNQEMMAKSLYPEELEKITCYTQRLLEKEAIFLTDLQWQILLNHLNEMILRKKQSEELPEVDPVIFSEVSQRSLQLAEQVVKYLGSLSEAEIYILSIHFENAN